jgi:hypothetical protein
MEPAHGGARQRPGTGEHHDQELPSRCDEGLDADRDAVVSDLSEHFQAGRLTAAEFDERTGRALTARTWGELTELAVDLPALRPAVPPSTPAAGRPQPPAGHTAPALTVALAGLAIAAVVVVHAVHGGWGLIWLLLPALLIARRALCH